MHIFFLLISRLSPLQDMHHLKAASAGKLQEPRSVSRLSQRVETLLSNVEGTFRKVR